RAGNFGMMGAAFGLGFIIGPALGGWIGEAFGPRAPFMLASVVCFLNFTFGYFFLPETLTVENSRRFQRSRANPAGGLISMARYPVVIGVLLAFFLMQLSHSALPAVWAYFSKEKFDWSDAQIGTSLAYVGVTAAFVQGYLTRKIIPKIGETKAVLIGLSAMIVSFCGYAFFTPTGSYVFLWITVGAVSGFAMPGMQGIMSRFTPANEQGELQGAIASLMSITLILSPLMMTQVFALFTHDGADPYFPGAPWVLAAFILSLSLIPFWLTMRKAPPLEEMPKPKPEAPQPAE
ncbi:MAG: MFS transporter, partial [Pseudomonadota bacterium]